MTAIKQGPRVLEAGRALAGILRDPDDLQQVFRLLTVLNAGDRKRFARAFAESRGGQRLAVERPSILPLLEDRAALRAMPEDSLGRAYLRFMERDDLDAESLVRANKAVVGERSDSLEDYLETRMRDTHDLWHVVTGYGGDLLGEGALLAFTYAQTFSPGIAVLASVGLVKTDPDGRRLLIDGFLRGMRAAWLPGVIWEELLDRPLGEVRAKLRVGAPPSYDPFYSRDLPEGGLFAPRTMMAPS
jgi:ubiquinone biosynthesis protein COQ4